MIKKLLFWTLFFGTLLYKAQSFSAKYNFASVSTTCASNCSVDPTPLPVVTGLGFGSFSAHGVDAAPNASGRFSFQGWPGGSVNGVDNYTSFTGSLSPSAYYEVALVPQMGYTLSVSGISFNVRRSGTGIRNYAVRSSLNGYTGNLPANVGANPNLAVLPGSVFFWSFDATSTSVDQIGSAIIPDSTFSSLTDTIRFRFYAWNSEGALGTFSMDSVVFAGLAYNTPPVVTGIPAIEGSGGGLRLFPNPSPFGDLTLESQEAFLNIQVLNCFGSAVFQFTSASPQRSEHLELSNLPPGTYYLKTEFLDGKKYYSKFIICK